MQEQDPSWEDPEVRGDQVPTTYVASGQWPHAELAADAPDGAHYGQEVARRLRSCMAERGLSQDQVADIAGLHQNTVSRVLRGAVYPDLATLSRLERALEINIYPTGLYKTYTVHDSAQSR